MFTIYIDDSGTAPEHKMAIAAGIIVPDLRIPPLENEWNTFLEKYKIPDFHASECLARNQHSAFSAWDDDQVRKVFARVRQITFKYSIKAFCIAIHKKDYDEVLTEDLKKAIGRSLYTWAASSVIGLASDWAIEHKTRMEYVFDNATRDVKGEIESSMDYMETKSTGEFEGHHSFRNRKEVPALQAVDLFAWTCFRAACKARLGHPIHPIAHESAIAYHTAREGKWWLVQSLNREGIEKWVADYRDSERTNEIIAFKQQRGQRPKRNNN